MKHIFRLALLLCCSTSFSQWTKVQELGSSDIFTLYHKDNTLYAGGRSVIYISRNKGQTWESTAIPQLSLVNSIIVYKNELYAAAPHSGVFKSTDDGRTWQNISAGIFPDVADFCEYRGDLYAATYGSSVFKLNPAGNSWLFFSNGLSNQSANLPAIAANSNAIIAGTLANGMYGQLLANSTNWEERFLTGRIDANEGAYDIITAHDSLFYAGHTGKFYMSTDNGFTWNLFGNRLASLYSPLLNARQALLTSAYFFDGANFNTAFFYIKKDALQNPFVNFSTVINHFTYKIDILDDKIWDASDRGLFYMSLSNLPGVLADDNSENTPILPVSFTLFNTKCDGGKVLITWKTAQEQNSSHFNIERSIDGTTWTVIGKITAAGNKISESSYSFSDNNPLQNGFYRIAQYNIDGQIHYTNTLQSSCTITEAFKVWPNPVQESAFISIVSGNNSQAIIKLFDSKGALVKIQSSSVLRGNNQLTVDMKSMAAGMYSLSVYWNNGLNKKTVQLLKQ